MVSGTASLQLKDMADVVTLRVLRWGGGPGLPRGTLFNHKGPQIGRWSRARSLGMGWMGMGRDPAGAS